MYISKINLKNWRNFKKVDVELNRRIFVVGPNASGKSNFLDAFRFLSDLVKPGGGLQKAVSERGGLSKIRCLNARSPEVEIEISLIDDESKCDLWKYAIGIKQLTRGHRHVLLDYERVWEKGEQILDRPDDNDIKDQDRLTQTHLEQIMANEKFREISKFLNSMQYLHLVPQLVRHPEAFSGLGIPGDPFGQKFLDRLAKTTNKTRASRLSKIESALSKVVPQLKELTFKKDEIGIPHLEALYEHWRPNAGKQREDQFSDGTLRLIGLLWSLLDGDSVLLLEEPELSLNVGIITKLPSLFYRIQKRKKRQIIISTHSADLLSDNGIGGEEVLLLIPKDEGTEIKLASEHDDIRLLLEGGFSVGDAVMPKIEPKKINELTKEQLPLFNL